MVSRLKCTGCGAGNAAATAPLDHAFEQRLDDTVPAEAGESGGAIAVPEADMQAAFAMRAVLML
jgi:hypothetical protein